MAGFPPSFHHVWQDISLKLSSKSIFRKFVHWALGVYYYLNKCSFDSDVLSRESQKRRSRKSSTSSIEFSRAPQTGKQKGHKRNSKRKDKGIDGSIPKPDTAGNEGESETQGKGLSKQVSYFGLNCNFPDYF